MYRQCICTDNVYVQTIMYIYRQCICTDNVYVQTDNVYVQTMYMYRQCICTDNNVYVQTDRQKKTLYYG